MGVIVLEIHTRPRHGFFSAFFGVLRALRECEVYGWIPKVVWGPSSPYHGQKNADENAWEYYFEPVVMCTGKLLPEMIDRVCREEFCGWDGIRCYEKMGILETLTVVYHKYIRIRPHVLAEIPTLPPNTIGVHYRGTDKTRTGEFEAPPIRELVERLRNHRVYTEKPFFFATDDVDAFTVIKRTFPDVLHTNCIRSSNGRSVHGHYEYVSESVTPTRDGPLKGLQVLVDALALSRCKHLLRCPSGVSLFALVSCPSGQLTFMDYTTHSWERFLYESPRNIVFYDVMHAGYHTRVRAESSEIETVWISNRGPPDDETVRTLHRLTERRDVYVVRGTHELLNASVLYDPECLKFALTLLRSEMSHRTITVDDETVLHQPIVSCPVSFTILCDRELWDDLESRVLRPLYEGRVRYQNREATVPIHTFPSFVLLLLSLCGSTIGLL